MAAAADCILSRLGLIAALCLYPLPRPVSDPYDRALKESSQREGLLIAAHTRKGGRERERERERERCRAGGGHGVRAIGSDDRCKRGRMAWHGAY